MIRIVPVALCAFVLGGCDLQERGDFLIGRACDPSVGSPCEGAQLCLPHIWDGTPQMFACRDAASFEPVGGVEAPLAFCDDAMGFVCPDGLVCNADRVRERESGVRRRVCQKPDGPFAPPLR